MDERIVQNQQPDFKAKAKFILLTFILVLVYSSFLFGATVYVDPTNTASGQNGSITNPYSSWSKVTFTNGNTYLQKCGTTNTTSSGIAFSGKSNITIGAYGTGTKPKILATGSGNHIFNISSSSNIIIKDIEVTSNGTWVSSIIIQGTNSANNQIDNCDLNGTEWGIRIITVASGNKILNSTVHNTGDDGIYIKDVNNIEIGYCNIHDVNLKYLTNPDQSYSAGDGIQMSSLNNLVVNIHDNIIDHSSMGNKFCIILYGVNYSGIIEKNTIIGNANNETSGIYLHPTTGTITVRYNVIKNANYGIYSYVYNLDVYYNRFSSNNTAISILTNYNLNARNNVFYNNTSKAISSNSSTSVTLKNNIFYLGSGSSKAISTGGTISSNNNVFNTERSGFINNYATLATWKSASGNDANSLVGNPNFINPTGEDFHLQPSSIAINKGANVSLSLDFFGGVVPQAGVPDIGIHEYSAQSNENQAPIINTQSFSIAQNATVGSIVGSVIASDPDAGQTLTYSIVSGNTNNVFAINSASGQITVAAALPLQNYSLIVKVTDNGSPVLSSQATVTINVTSVNQSPLINAQSFAIAQNATVGSIVGSVIATDPDAGQTLTYSIVSGNTNNVFAINSALGQITVAAALPLQNFSLNVKVTDNGSPVLSSQATVTINVTSVNQSPLINAQSFAIAQNATVGSIVGSVIATDPDADQTLTYSIVSGNTNNVFAINSASGQITVAAALPLQNFSLNVKVTDNGSPVLSSQATVTINVTSVNQSPLINAQSFAIAQNASIGSIVGSVIASDPDAGQTLTYTIVSGNTNNVFAINSASGQITVAAALPLQNFSLNVKVTDNGSPVLSSQATVTINVTSVNQSPLINAQTFEIEQNASIGSIVGSVIATDPDAGQTLTYSIVSGNTNNVFAINSTSGQITVVAALPLQNYSLIVKATDNGSPVLSSQATITIYMTGGNQAPYMQPYTFSVKKYASKGTFVGVIAGTDPDAGQTLTYAITSGNYNNAFVLNNNTGVIRVNNKWALNPSTNPVFVLEVIVTDNGQPNMSYTQNVTINVRSNTRIVDNITLLDNSATQGNITEFSNESQEMVAYPNPSNDGKFSVDFGQMLDNTEIEVYDLTGRFIKRSSINQTTKVSVDLSENPDGTYLIRVKTANGIETLKVIKN